MRPLVCIRCRTGHPPPATRCACGGALDYTGATKLPTLEDVTAPGRGVWRYRGLLGVRPEHVVKLGEGDTPLVWDDQLQALLKLEYVSPTGSFKDRGSTVVLSMAKGFGARGVVEDSSGNAGTAVAAYAARAGMPCRIFAPATITAAKRQQIETLGASVQVVPGPREGVTEAAVQFARKHGAYYASHAYTPHFLEGCATLAYELVAELGRQPDVLVAPCAMGSILLGAFRGFQRLQRSGVIPNMPRLVAVQAAGYDPIARALGEPPSQETNRITDGLMIRNPPRMRQVVDALAGTGGTAVSVNETDTRKALAAFHRRGFLIEPSSAVVAPAIERLRGAGRIARDETVVAVLTGRWKPPAGPSAPVSTRPPAVATSADVSGQKPDEKA